jgi:hypothetical protein
MPLAIGIGIGASIEGVGVSWTVGTPTIAVVTPVTNPPAFDINFNDTVLVGDVIKLRIDGATTYSSAALSSGDLLAGTVTITNGTLSLGDHTADASVWRGGVQVSAWSNVSSYTITSDRWQLEDASGYWQLEDASGSWALEAA